MRISTRTIFDSGVDNILARQKDLSNTQMQISTGRRVLAPSDDPVAAAQMLDVSEAKAINQQYRENTQTVKSRLALEESSLSSVVSLVQSVQTLTVQAGDGSLSAADRASLAVEIDARYQELLALANATDGNGEYLFAGFRTQARPFSETAPGVVAYFGDEGRREVAVSGSRAIALNDPGSDVFNRIRNGNGTFAAAPATANTGTGVVSPGSVTNAALLTGHDYSITFSVTAGVTTYDVVDLTTSTAVVTGAPYVQGGPIGFDGLQVEIEGAPANGDSFSIEPSTNVSLFATLHDLRGALRSGGDGAAANARLTNALNAAHSGLKNGLDRVLTVTASLGTRMRETEAIATNAEDVNLQHETRLSSLRDLDYTSAISELNFQQLHLEAAQKSFLRVTEMSLFSLL